MKTTNTIDWRLAEEDEPEVPNEEIFGPDPAPDPMTAALEKVAELVLHSEAESLDYTLFEEWREHMRDTGNVAAVERYARYLAA